MGSPSFSIRCVSSLNRRGSTISMVLVSMSLRGLKSFPSLGLPSSSSSEVGFGAWPLSELMEAGQLTLVENVATRPSLRAPEGLAPQMAAIYLISPTASSIAAVIADYEDERRDGAVYGGACHILLCRRLPDELLQELRSCPQLMRHVKTLRELHLHFLALQAWRRGGLPDGGAAPRRPPRGAAAALRPGASWPPPPRAATRLLNAWGTSRTFCKMS